MMQLNPVNKEKSTEKFVDGGGKAANEVVDESYPKSNWRGWKAFVAREDQRVLLLHQAQLLEDPLVLVGDLGSFPSRDLHFLPDALDLAAVCLVSFVRGGMELRLVDKVDGRRHERKEMEIGNGDGRERIGARRSERDNRRRKKVIYSKSNESSRRWMVGE